MTEVLHSPSSSSSPTHTATLFHREEGISSMLTENEAEEEHRVREKRENDRTDQLSLLALLVALFRKSFWVACKTDTDSFATTSSTASVGGSMEIGWPTDVQHVNHVTFDRFDGFLGLPVEFEPEVPRRPPSASATVFGVSTESMQLSYDSRGNIIPTILLLMQRHLYSLGGLQVEGIFRLTAGSSQEVFVRDQLNRGVVPEGVDVHCLAGLIKAWFRELPRGVLDSLSPEQVMQCQSEEECDVLVRLLPSTEAALLDWAINLMADVVQEEHLNKMNARNIAMVFAPNMTQMADPLTALMYAVQVMNFLKMLIEKTLSERKDSLIDPPAFPRMEHSDDNGHQSCSRVHHENNTVEFDQHMTHEFVEDDPSLEIGSDMNHVDNSNTDTDEDYLSYSSDESGSCETPVHIYKGSQKNQFEENKGSKNGQSSDDSNHQLRNEIKSDGQLVVDTVLVKIENKNKGISNLSRINSMSERFEAWR